MQPDKEWTPRNGPLLEGWWQKTRMDWMEKGLDVTIICTHPSLVLQENATNEHVMEVLHNHSLALDLKDFAQSDLQHVVNASDHVIGSEPDVATSMLSTMESVLGARCSN
jgi:hypothetical protein